MNNAQQKQFFQQCLYTALRKLMAQKAFTDISIAELCAVAGVSRMTYYRSYTCKEEILLQHLDELFLRYYDHLQSQKHLTFYELSLSFFHFIHGQEDAFFEAIIQAGLASLLMDRFYVYLERIFTLIPLRETPNRYLRSFVAGGLYKMLIDWLKSGADLPEAEMARLLTSFSAAGQAL